jgi:hypothetical protein
VAAWELRPGDQIMGQGGQLLEVESVTQTGIVETVYNVRVAEWHTYFVGCDEWEFSVWAHNACVSLYKAPAKGRGAKQFATGYDATDFTQAPVDGGDNRLYFAKDRWIADSYAVHGPYGEGVIEIQIDKDEYDKHLASYEHPYVGENVHTGKVETGVQLDLPASTFPILNKSKRIWHK